MKKLNFLILRINSVWVLESMKKGLLLSMEIIINSAEINLPKGSWNLLISTDEMRNDKMKRYEGVIMLKPTSGILLEQK